jgi:manganese/zinc/iron transport system permease protein
MGLGVLVFNAMVIGLLYKEFKITAFDPEMASAAGIPARPMYYLLMALVAITTVASFESVGSILVIAMLIVPAAAAQFAAVRLGGVIAWSLVFAIVSAVGGHLAAITVPGWFGFIDTSTSGSMAVVSGLVFTGSFLMAPRRGLIARWWARRMLRHRIAREDLLGTLFRWQEEQATAAPGPTIDTLLSRLRQTRKKLTRAVARLRRERLIEPGDATEIRMTAEGQRQASGIIRDHRLWERYLHTKADLPADHVHATSENLEHVTDAQLRRTLQEEAQGASVDPHGKHIP